MRASSDIKSLLDKIVCDPKLHASWLESLSYLENCGAHKLMHYQDPESVDLLLLQHTAEETRHAFFFKAKAQRVDSLSSKRGKLLNRRTKRYLDLLELRIAREYRPKNPEIKRICYLLTSLVIEERATQLYTLYNEVLKKNNAIFNLDSILREEESHLRLMQNEVNTCIPAKQGLDSIREFEAHLFEEVLQGVEAYLTV